MSRDHAALFARLKQLIANAEEDIGPLNETQRQLLGLYMLSARQIGERVGYDARPKLEPATDG